MDTIITTTMDPSSTTIILPDNSVARDEAKILAIIILGIGSFVFGLLPTCIPRESQRRCPLLITILLCFGAGVLFSTSLVHMLADVSIERSYCLQYYFKNLTIFFL